jgi:predicted lipoprotein with Yx(FWY)xxD motif
MNNFLKKAAYLLFTGILLITAATWLSGCGEDEKIEPPTVKLAQHATFGDILTDDEGRTLYFYARDAKGDPSACTGGCLNRWPVFYRDKVVVTGGTALSLSDFGTIGAGATLQTTYKGWPLYYFAPAGDNILEAAGEVGGDNYNSGRVWFVAKPDYAIMIVNTQLVGNNAKNYTVTAGTSTTLGTYVEGTGNTFYFTDDKGNTLYLYTEDKNNINTYTSAGLNNNAGWPIFHRTSTKFPSIVNASDFASITVQGAAQQLTYKGWPLYYYGDDKARGINKGVSVPNPGVWPVVFTTTIAAPN